MTAPLPGDARASDSDWAYARMLYDFHLTPGNLFEVLAFSRFDAERGLTA